MTKTVNCLSGLFVAASIVALPVAARAETRTYYCKADGTNYIVTVNTVTRVVMLDDYLLDRVIQLTLHRVEAFRVPAGFLGFHVSLVHTSPKTADFELTIFGENSRSPSGYVGRCNFERG